MAFTTVWHKEQAKPCVPETPIAHRTVKRIAFMLIDSDGACRAANASAFGEVGEQVANP